MKGRTTRGMVPAFVEDKTRTSLGRTLSARLKKNEQTAIFATFAIAADSKSTLATPASESPTQSLEMWSVILLMSYPNAVPSKPFWRLPMHRDRQYTDITMDEHCIRSRIARRRTSKNTLRKCVELPRTTISSSPSCSKIPGSSTVDVRTVTNLFAEHCTANYPRCIMP